MIANKAHHREARFVSKIPKPRPRVLPVMFPTKEPSSYNLASDEDHQPHQLLDYETFVKERGNSEQISTRNEVHIDKLSNYVNSLGNLFIKELISKRIETESSQKQTKDLFNNS